MTSFKFTAFRSLGVIIGFCLALLAPSVASALVLDNFQGLLTGSPVTRTTVSPGATIVPQGPGLIGVLGGNRVSTISLDSFTGGSSIFKTTMLSIGGGGLFFASTSGVIGHFKEEYAFSSPMNVAFPEGSTFLKLDIQTIGVSGLFTVILSDGGPQQMVTQVASTAGIKMFNLSGVGVNLNALTYIAVKYQGEPGATLELGGTGFELVTVPEPSSLAIALTGLGMAGVYLRRHRKQLIA